MRENTLKQAVARWLQCVVGMKPITKRNRIFTFGLALALATFVLPGCGDSDNETDIADGGSGGSGGSGEGGMGGSPSCNSIDFNQAPVVEVMEVDSDLPTPMGGVFEPGMLVTAHLTGITHYTGVGGAVGPTGETRQEVTDCDGTTCTVVVATTPTLEEVRFSWDTTYSGTEMMFTETCGNGIPTFSLPYSFENGTTMLFQGNTVFTYTQQD